MSVRVGILTVSDRSFLGERPDSSGPALEEVVRTQGWSVAAKAIMPDEVAVLSEVLERWADSGEVDLILTTGGTGLSPRDVTPEATQAVIDRPAPGLRNSECVWASLQSCQFPRRDPSELRRDGRGLPNLWSRICKIL